MHCNDLPQFFISLDVESVFNIIKKVEESYCDLLRRSTPCRIFQRDCLRALAFCNFSNCSGELVEEILFLFVTVDDYTILKHFVDSSSLEEHLERLLSSADVWNECLATVNGEKALGQMVGKCISQLNSVPLPVFSWSQPDCCLPGNAPKVIIDFLRGNQEKGSFTSESWKMHSEVLKYFNSIFGDLNNTLARGFSIRIEISLSTEGERGYSLVISKTREYFEEVVMGNYHKRQQEIKVLNCVHISRLYFLSFFF